MVLTVSGDGQSLNYLNRSCDTDVTPSSLSYAGISGERPDSPHQAVRFISGPIAGAYRRPVSGILKTNMSGFIFLILNSQKFQFDCEIQNREH